MTRLWHIPYITNNEHNIQSEVEWLSYKMSLIDEYKFQIPVPLFVKRIDCKICYVFFILVSDLYCILQEIWLFAIYLSWNRAWSFCEYIHVWHYFGTMLEVEYHIIFPLQTHNGILSWYLWRSRPFNLKNCHRYLMTHAPFLKRLPGLVAAVMGMLTNIPSLHNDHLGKPEQDVA